MTVASGSIEAWRGVSVGGTYPINLRFLPVILTCIMGKTIGKTVLYTV